MSKRKLHVASSKHWRDVSHNHYTTMGFGTLVPTFVDEVEPGAKVKIDLNANLISSQTEQPLQSKLSIINRGFYCPFSNVWKYYNDFMEGNGVFVDASDSSVQRTIFKEVPSITAKMFTQIFIGDVIDYQLTVIADSDNFDFAVRNDATHGELFDYYRLTKHGKQVLQIFNALGYNYNFGDNDETRDSALPLLCFFKVIYDYYIPANLRPSSRIDQALSWLNTASPSSTDGSLIVDAMIWYWLFADYLLYYDNNYFTSQWLYPTKPVEGINNFDTLITNSISQQTSAEQYLTTQNSPVKASNQNINSIGQGGINADINIMLQSLRKFIIRNNLVGSRPVQRLFARFGVHVPELELQMSRYVGSGSYDLINYDVAGTSDSNLGKLAGQSTINRDNSNKFNCNCELYGMVFVLSSIDVPSSPISGIRRRNMHVKPFDFFTPEFANGTLQATSGRELIGKIGLLSSATKTSLQSCGLRKNDIFGFSERYSEYTQKLDVVSGDYDIPSLNENIDKGILPRKLYDNVDYILDARLKTPTEQEEISIKDYAYNEALTWNRKISPVDLMNQSDVAQFNRPYLDILGYADPFRVHFHIDCRIHGNVTPSELSQFVAGDGEVFEVEKNGPHMD